MSTLGATSTTFDLSGAFDAKAALSHTHAESDVTSLVADLALKEVAANKGAASGYASLDGSTKVPIAQVPTGTTSSTVCLGNDSRLSDSRTPTAHATTHKSGGTDPITLAELAVPAGSVDFNGQQATSFRVENLTSDPVSPTVGQLWLRTDL